MSNLYYNPQELALILRGCNLDPERAEDFVDNIWKNESEHLFPEHRESRKQLQRDVREACNHIRPGRYLSAEFPVIAQDGKSADGLHSETVSALYRNIRLYLIAVRLRILYIQKQPEVRVTMKQLLKEYGYRRRNKSLINYMKETLEALDLKATDRYRDWCDLGKISQDDIILFFVNSREPIQKNDWQQYMGRFHDGNLFFRDRHRTDDMEKAIEDMGSFEEFETFFDKDLISGNSLLGDYLDHLLKKYGTNPTKIARLVGRSEGHMRKLAAGQEEHPDRDLMLAICTELQTTVEEAQILLRYSGNRPLYARDKRDAIIWFALKKQLSSVQLECYLLEHGFEPLVK